jgi:hypothetical protein
LHILTSACLAAIGTAFRGLEDEPVARLERLGYRETYAESLVARSLSLRRVPIPSFVRHLLWLVPVLRDGYRVVGLEFGPARMQARPCPP